MGKLMRFFKTPVGILVIVVILVFLYAQWRGSMTNQAVNSDQHPQMTQSPIRTTTEATVTPRP